jgi:hypothetical protein
MAKVRVLVAFEFDDLEPGSVDEERTVQEIRSACETMRIGFDAQNCWVEDTLYIETEEA